jgi:micrococcal nuclease
MKIEPKPEFWATVIRWVDGDTLTMMVDQWFDDFKRITCRVLGINTPERGKPGYTEATEYGESFAPPGTTIAIRTYKPDSFGRWLAEVQLPDGREYAAEILDLELGVPYVQKKYN